MKTKTTIFLTLFLVLGIGVLPSFAESKNRPSGFLDAARYQNGQLLVSGWAADKVEGAPLKKVAVHLDGKFFGDAKLGIVREDVATAMKNPNWKKSGWELSKPIQLKKGTHEVVAEAFNKKGEKTKLNKIKLTIE